MRLGRVSGGPDNLSLYELHVEGDGLLLADCPNIILVITAIVKRYISARLLLAAPVSAYASTLPHSTR
jgi:hypothetical protein